MDWRSHVFEDGIKEIMQNTVRQGIVIDETEYSGFYCSIYSPAQNSAAWSNNDFIIPMDSEGQSAVQGTVGTVCFWSVMSGASVGGTPNWADFS